jgi:uncharacterized surface protein with fasciclin (FAS1) repeats
MLPHRPTIRLRPPAEATAPTGSGVIKISEIFGAACDQVPKEGPGSAQGMVNEPVATAASHNPLLTTLSKAVTAANLGDTLNSAPAITVFAPADPAFQAFRGQEPRHHQPADHRPDVASPNSKLAKILTYHVVGKRYDAAGIVSAGTLDSLEGAKLAIGGTDCQRHPGIVRQHPHQERHSVHDRAGAVPAGFLS